MAGWLLAQGSAGAIGALLVAGHMVGDFVVQTRDMVARKREPPRLILHVACVVAAQAVFLGPFLSSQVLAALLVLGVLHAVIDRTKLALQGRHDASLALFASDQLAHLAVLFGVWLVLRNSSGGWLGTPNEASLRWLTSAAVLIAAYAWNGNGAAAVVAGLLRGFPLPAGPAAAVAPAATAAPGAAVGAPGADAGAEARSNRLRMACGRMIGILERILALTLVLLDQWGGLGLIMAAKSIARFRDLEERAFGEYYLIGTLSSLLLAVAAGVLVKFLIG